MIKKPATVSATQHQDLNEIGHLREFCRTPTVVLAGFMIKAVTK